MFVVVVVVFYAFSLASSQYRIKRASVCFSFFNCGLLLLFLLLCVCSELLFADQSWLCSLIAFCVCECYFFLTRKSGCCCSAGGVSSMLCVYGSRRKETRFSLFIVS